MYTLFAFIGGLLPDIDSSTSKSKKIIFTILAIIFSLIFFEYQLSISNPDYMLLIKTISCYIIIRYVFSAILNRYVVHRGIFHSIPVMFCWAFGIADFIHYYNFTHQLDQWLIALNIAIGYFSHLLLDELYSVDLANARLKKSFGSAIKFASVEPIPTLIAYILMIILWIGMPSWNNFISSNNNLTTLLKQINRLEQEIKDKFTRN